MGEWLRGLGGLNVLLAEQVDEVLVCFGFAVFGSEHYSFCVAVAKDELEGIELFGAQVPKIGFEWEVYAHALEVGGKIGFVAFEFVLLAFGALEKFEGIFVDPFGDRLIVGGMESVSSLAPADDAQCGFLRGNSNRTR